MTESVEVLLLDLLEWVGPTFRPYAEVMDAWRTSCPRMPVWEIANERGFLERSYEPEYGAVIAVSARGMQYLSICRSRAPRIG